ncbi:MAG TPA: DUF5667 domain-containing protein [Verrucomicrobiae bacterium]|nr:DUF5667 domain-containing protein [Verrucomicrobiae bacterium]
MTDDMNEHELLEFAREIARTPHPAMPRGERSALRASLLVRPEPPRRVPLAWPRVFGSRPIFAALVVLAILVGAGGTAAADSLPGDPAFALKRAGEDVQVALAPDDAARLDVLVTQSDRRLMDLEKVVAVRASAIGAATDEYIAAVARLDAALSTLVAQPARAARDAAIARASAASADHLAALQALAARLPTEAQAGLARAIAAQETVHGRSRNAPGRGGAPAPAQSAAPGRPSTLPVTPGRGGPPSGVPGRP